MKKSLVLLIFLFFLTFSSGSAQPAESINPDLFIKEWPAAWISYPGISGKEYGVFNFRRVFNLSEKPSTFTVLVSADNRYRLFVNGKSVGTGPARGDKLHWKYETYDLAPYLKAGRNSIAAIVWNMGSFAPLAQMSILTGFLMQGNSPKESVVSTNAENWKVFQNAAYRPYPVTPDMVNHCYYAMGACDSLDGTKYPWGWEQTDYDDDLWLKPVCTRTARPAYFAFGTGEGDGNLMPRSIPFMEEKNERIAKIVRTEGIKADMGFLNGTRPLVIPPNAKVSILLDQTWLTTAYPELLVSGGKGSSIDISYAEALLDSKMKKGVRNEIENKNLYGYHDAFLPDGGDDRLFSTLWYRTFRFIQINIITAGEPLVIKDFRGVFTAYPFEELASFVSDDTTLSTIWNTGWRTARLCAHETYFDCPYYEQLQYIGDTRIQALISLYVAGDDRLIRNALELFDYSRLSEGITQSRYPSELPQMIPPFSLFWVSMVHDFYMYRDDKEFVKKFLPGIRGTLNWFENHLDNEHLLNRLGWWNFADWAPEFQLGVPDGASEGKGSALISLQFVYALEHASELFKAFGLYDEAGRYSRLSDSVRTSVYKHCYDEQKGLFADTPDKNKFSQHTNVMAILTNTLPLANQSGLMKRILADKSLIQCTIYYKFYLLHALKKSGFGDQYCDNLDIWKKMINDGLTTLAETDKDARSDCHAWSSSPMIEFLATVCGIEPLSPGFKSVRIEPHLGRLKNVDAAMPHLLGSIEVRLKRTGANGVFAEINLPEGLTGIFIWNGKKTLLKSGKQIISE